MSDTDRSWTVAPTLLAFVGFAVVGIALLDGNLDAVAQQLTTKHAAAAPAIVAKPATVAEADDGEDAPAGEKGLPPPTPGSGSAGDRGKLGPLEDTCLDGTPAACKRWALDGFYAALAKQKAGKLGRAVRVSWFGDSVVATDAIPGRLRTRMQTDLGDGGPGFVWLAAPHRFVGHEAITRSNTGDWQPHAISTIQVADGLYGPGGSSVETRDGTATVKLVAGKVSLVELYYLAQPHGGIATITADGKPVTRAETSGDTKQPGWAAATIEGGAGSVKVETAGRVRMFGLTLENPTGAVVDNLGIVSVNVKSFANHDVPHWTAELAHRNADLVIVMIGANEAQWLGPADQDTKAYAANYGKLLAPIRREGSACLVVSPTDQAEAKDGAYPSRPVMPVLVAAQRTAAAALGCGFFSTYDWMGGKGSAATWFAKGYVGSDFQHLSKKGANKMADAVYDTLMAAYARSGAH